MSVNKHEKSIYRLRRLPSCSRCNAEFILTLAAYDSAPGTFWEWECPKCHKIVPKELLREEKIHKEDLRIKEPLIGRHRK